MIDSKLVSFVNDEIRRGRTKSEINDLLFGAGMSEQDAENFWKEFLQSNAVPQGFNVIKPQVIQKTEQINIPTKTVEIQSKISQSSPVSGDSASKQEVIPSVENSSQSKSTFQYKSLKFIILGVVVLIIAGLAFTAFVFPGFLNINYPLNATGNKTFSNNSAYFNKTSTANVSNKTVLSNANSSGNSS